MASKVSKTDTAFLDFPGARWPVEARLAVSAAIVVHVVAVLAAALAASPSSSLERAVADRFTPYYQLLDQGHSYRYYAPEPGPTPIVTAVVRYGDGRPERTVRLPSRGVSPRLRYQRQLALAYHLTARFEEHRQSAEDGTSDPYARSYARHVARSHPGCAAVTLYTRSHLIPPPEMAHRAFAEGRTLDIDADEFYTVPERIGEFPCDGL